SDGRACPPAASKPQGALNSALKKIAPVIRTAFNASESASIVQPGRARMPAFESLPAFVGVPILAACSTHLHIMEAFMAASAIGTRPLPDPRKLDAFMGRFVGDLGAAYHAGMVVIGEKLGLYKALADGPSTSDELAAR